jgi:CRISPR-associated endonuclease/helicase Cas3
LYLQDTILGLLEKGNFMLSPLYPYQNWVSQRLWAGQNLILQAPTGAGKTRAALHPFLEARKTGRPFPSQCIYAVPLRILAKQFVIEAQALAQGMGLEVKIALQTGDQADDTEFEADLLFTTIDQALSSYLLQPYSLSRRRGNLNAGALTSAYLVFDEFHLYDPTSTLPTTLQMVRDMRGLSPFLLMTATFSRTMLRGLAEVLGAEVLPVNVTQAEEFFNALPSQAKTRRYHTLDVSLTAEAVLATHDRRSLAICNTVERARALYQGLRAIAPPSVEVLLLHSQFLRPDRDRIEARIRATFGREADRSQGSLIVVATQAIEVGLDISAQVLHSELAPANALLQRAGRCARYAGERGDVYLYRYTQDENGATLDLGEATAPYHMGKGETPLALPTWEAFNTHDGQALRFMEENALVSAVHGAEDAAIVAALGAKAGGHRQAMQAVMRHDSQYDPRHLIREASSQRVTLHPEPYALLDEMTQARGTPYQVEGFNLHPGTLQKHLEAWLSASAELEIRTATVGFLREVADDDAEGRRYTTYEYVPLLNPEDKHLAWGSPLLIIHPLLASYTATDGFTPTPLGGADWQGGLAPRPTKPTETYRYRLETYAQHLAAVGAAFEDVWPSAAWGAARLEALYGWPEGSVRRAAELAIALHDAGKLSQAWQDWVAKYQNHIGEPVQTGQAYAHTTYDAAQPDQREAEKKLGRRPPHAVQGAIVALPYLRDALGDNLALISAVFSAIARHHSPHAEQASVFRLRVDARQHLEAVSFSLPPQKDLPALGKALSSREAEKLVRDFLIQPAFLDGQDEQKAAYLTYLLLARVLRRADSLGTARQHA